MPRWNTPFGWEQVPKLALPSNNSSDTPGHLVDSSAPVVCFPRSLAWRKHSTAMMPGPRPQPHRGLRKKMTNSLGGDEWADSCFHTRKELRRETEEWRARQQAVMQWGVCQNAQELRGCPVYTQNGVAEGVALSSLFLDKGCAECELGRISPKVLSPSVIRQGSPPGV